jgi:hypothetical protein
MILNSILEEQRVMQDQFAEWCDRRMNSVGDERYRAGLKVLELLADEQDEEDSNSDTSGERQHD